MTLIMYMGRLVKGKAVNAHLLFGSLSFPLLYSFCEALSLLGMLPGPG
jgi:hypothetical protein